MSVNLEKSRCLYQLLNLPDFSVVEEVRQAYRTLAFKYHPDKNLGDPSAAEKFRDISLAYEILSDADRKQKYDCSLRIFKPPGSTVFASAAKAAAAAGVNPYLFTPTAAAGCCQSDSGSYSTRWAEIQKRRAHSISNKRKDERASQYTEEQKEFFKRREKERQAELRKRLEREKSEQRARELGALRREQERREEIKQRRYQQPLGVDSRRSCSSSIYRRPSPFIGTTTEQRSIGETCKESLKTFLPRESSARAKLPDTVRPLASPRPKFVALNTERDQLERVRRQRERQVEVQRAEQERYLKRIIRRRVQEERLREKEAKEMELQAHIKRQEMLALSEKSEREQLLIPQEELERRSLLLKQERSIQNCWFVFYLRELVAQEDSKRTLLGVEANTELRILYLQAREALKRVLCYRDAVVARENIIVCHTKELYNICMHKQPDLVEEQRKTRDLLLFYEAFGFCFIQLLWREAEDRFGLEDKYADESFTLFTFHNKMREQDLIKRALADSRKVILKREELERAILWIVLGEWAGRRYVQTSEERDVLNLIRQRANGLHEVHLIDLQRARLVERRAHAVKIAMLRLEVQRLRHAMTMAPLNDTQKEEHDVSVHDAACSWDLYRANDIAAVTHSDTCDVCNDSSDTAGFASDNTSFLFVEQQT